MLGLWCKSVDFGVRNGRARLLKPDKLAREPVSGLDVGLGAFCGLIVGG